MAQSPKLYQFLVGMFASLGSFLFGYDLGVIAGVIAAPKFIEEFHPNDSDSGLVVSLFTGGAFVGAALAAPLADLFGRRATLFVGALIFLVGGSVQTAAQNLAFLWGGRLVAGLGIGFLVMIVPLYQAELAHPSIRGRVTGLQQFMLGAGSFVAAWVTYGTFVGITTNSGQWRISLAIQNVPAIVLAALIWLFPESPRWLIAKGREELGLQTLARLHSSGDVSDAFVQQEFEQIRAAVEADRLLEARSYMELFRSKNTFRRVFLCCAIQASIQMTGVAAIQYFAPTIYAQIGIPASKSLLYQGISNAWALVGEMSCMLFIDRFGRRWTMIGGMLLQMCTFLVATVLLAKFNPHNGNVSGSKAAQWAFIVVTCWLFNYIFSATSGSLSWIIPSEVFDTRTRAKGVSLATMTSFAFNTMIGQVTPKAMTNIGYRFYYLFVICNFTNAVFFWLLLPETARVPLEDMEKIFSGSWIVVGSKTPRVDVEAENEMKHHEGNKSLGIDHVD